MRSAVVWALAGTAVFISIPSAARADLAPITVALTLSTVSSDAQAAPATASDSLGRAVAVWQRQQAVTGWDIFARRFDAAGVALGTEFQVNTASTGCQQFPAVARAANGSSVIVWQSETDGAGFGIVGRTYAADGTPSGGEFAINTTTAGDQLFPSVAMAPAGAFLVTWQGPDASGSGIFGRTFSGNGTPTSAEFPIPETTLGAQVTPAVAYSASATAPDRFWVVWSSLGQDSSGGGVYRRSFGLTGTALSTEAPVPLTTDSTQTRPRIATDASGNLVIAWEGVGADGSASGVVVRRFTAGGTPLSGDVAINTTTSGEQGTPTLTSLGEGDFVVAWRGEGQDGDGGGIVLREFDHRQLPVGSEAIANTTVLGDQTAPAGGAGVSGPVFVAWQSEVAGALPTVLGRFYRFEGRDFFTLSPCRLVDTRNANGPLGGPALAANVARNFPVIAAACGVPASARALSLNVTMVDATGNGELVLYPGDAALPNSSTVSFVAGINRANNTVMAVARGGDGSLTARSTLAIHLIIDVNGYFQ